MANNPHIVPVKGDEAARVQQRGEMLGWIEQVLAQVPDLPEHLREEGVRLRDAWKWARPK